MFTLLITLALGDGFGHPALWGAAAAAWLLGEEMVQVGFQFGMLLMFVSFVVLLLARSAIVVLQDLAATPAGTAVCRLWVILRDYAREPALQTSYMYVAAIYLVVTAGAAYYAMLRSSVVPVALVCVTVGVR